MTLTPTTEPRRRRLDRGQVIDAADRLVAERGWDALTMAALGEELGVKPSSLYRHVESVDAIRLALQLRTVTELGEARKEIQTLLAQFKEAAATQADLLSLNETEFKRVLALDSAHYNLSAQSFTAVWAVLDFLQRFMVDPILANNPQHKPDPHAESVRQRRDARVEGLQMAERMDEQFQSPQPIQMVLISPPGEG